MTHLVARNHFAWFDRPRSAAPGGMPVNVYETETGIAIDASLPGFDREDIEVTVERGRLRIRAEHNVDACDVDGHNHQDRRYRYREVYRRRAERSFDIGDRFESGAIEAQLGNGVLHLDLPRSETAQAQKIEIDAN